MVRAIAALVATLAAVVTVGATSTPAANKGDAPSTVVEAGSNQWCC